MLGGLLTPWPSQPASPRPAPHTTPRRGRQPCSSWGTAGTCASSAAAAGWPAICPQAERARVEGAVDAAVWSIAAVASLASTAVLSSSGYPVLAGAAGALTVIPAILLGRR